MRVLMTTDTVGGVWTFASELTKQLLLRGHEIYLVSFGRRQSTAQQDWCTEQWRMSDNRFTSCATNIPLEWMQENETAFEDGQQEILDDINHFQPDLILANQFCFGRLNTTIPRVVVAHSDVLSWAIACQPSALEPSPWLNRYISMVQDGLLDASAVIAPTAWMGKALKANFFLPRHYSVIPNGLTPETTSAPTTERKLQAITAGRVWDEAKGLSTLSNLDAPMPLLVAGDNTFDTANQQTHWPAHLTNLGPLSQPALHEHFRQSAIYLCTSLYEPFGLAPLEAALCGCAVIARDLPSLREVWDDGALYFTDASSLQHLLQSLAISPDTLAQAQHRARQRAGHFTPERMTDNYLHLFETVLHGHEATHHAP